jgi:hypothetical protein
MIRRVRYVPPVNPNCSMKFFCGTVSSVDAVAHQLIPWVTWHSVLQVRPPTGGSSVRLTRQLLTSETYLLKRRIILTCTVIVNVFALNVYYLLWPYPCCYNITLQWYLSCLKAAMLVALSSTVSISTDRNTEVVFSHSSHLHSFRL